MKKFLLMCFSFCFAISVWAQDRVVSGKLTSKEDGTALPGVNVLLKGTTNGTVSDADGHFSFSVPSSGGTLVFSFIGLESQEVEIGDRSVVDVQMGSDIKQLTEVVVTAQGIQSEKRALGYAITTVAGTAVENRPEQDIGRLLDGKVPGVVVQNSTGVAGSATNIIIRGYTTVTGSKQPLFVVDGAVFNSDTNTPGGQSDAFNGSSATTSRFADLDQNNIESIQVLKGLAAAVLYGANGRNGVILITTKNGKTSKGEHFDVSVNQSVFVSKIASLPDYQPAYGNGFQQNWGNFFSNWGPSYKQRDSIPDPYGNFSDATLQSQFPTHVGKNIAYRPYPNSVKNFFQTGVSTNTSVNLNGSKNGINYNFSVGNTKENGFVPNNVFSKTNVGLGVNGQVSERLTIGVSMNYVQTDMATPPISAAGGSGITGGGESVFADVLYTPVNIDLMHLPFEAPVDHRSVYYRGGNDIQNPRWTAKYTRQTDGVRRFYGSANLKFKIAKDLTATYTPGIDTYNETQEYKVNKGGPQNINGFYRTQNIQNTIMNHNFVVQYSHRFGDWNLSVLGGGQSRYDYRNAYGMYSSNQVIFGQMNHNNFISHSNNDGLTGANLNNSYQIKQQGVYGSVTLDYKDYLYFTAQARKDWYSTLEKANNSIVYPSASVSFVPTTAFGIESETLNSLKLRASYGSSAGFPPPYTTRNYVTGNSRPFLNASGNALTSQTVNDQLGNPNLKAELQSEIEFGAEATLLKKRLDFDFSYFNRNTTNLIMQAPIDPATGYTGTSTNLGKLTNQGVELNIHGVPIIAGDFRWDLNLNFYHYTSIVNNLGNSGLTQVQIAGYSGGPSNWAIAGKAFDMIQGTYVQRDANGNMLVGADGNYISSHDIKPIGNPIPQYTSYLTSSFSYKGITLSVRIDYRKGGAIYSTTAGTELARGITQDTNFNRDATFILPGVLQDGSKNNIQLTSSDAFFNNYGFGPNEFQVYDGTTIRLGQASLGYSIPKVLLKKTAFKAVNITFNGQNLWYNAVNFPKHSHFDTNQLSTGVGNALGLDFLTGPSAHKYGVTLGLKF